MINLLQKLELTQWVKISFAGGCTYLECWEGIKEAYLNSTSLLCGLSHFRKQGSWTAT